MTIAGFRLAEVLPGRSVYLPHRDGLTAIYGRNGAGKSRLLDALAGVLTADYEVAQSDDAFQRIIGAARVQAVHCTFGCAVLSEVLPAVYSDVHGYDLDDQALDEEHGFLADDFRDCLSETSWLGPPAAGIENVAWDGLFDRMAVCGRAVAITHGSIQAFAIGLPPDELPDVFRERFDTQGSSTDDRVGLTAQLWQDHRRRLLPPWAAIPLLAVRPDDGGIALMTLTRSAVTGTVSFVGATGTRPEDASSIVQRCTDVLSRYHNEGERGVRWSDAERQMALAFLDDPTTGMARLANAEFVRFLGDQTAELRLVQDSDRWRWMATDDEGATLYPLEGLSRAQRKWATVAMEAATHEALGYCDRVVMMTRGPMTLYMTTGRAGYRATASIVVIDEPEEALHPTAIHRVANALGHAGHRAVYAATHSPVVIAAADQAVHLIRNDSGHELRIEDGGGLLQPVLELTDRTDHGLLPSDFLALSRVLILSEGAHDALVIRTLLGQQLAQARGLLARALGTSNVPGLIRDLLAFRALTCPLLVLVDDFQEEDRKWWSEVADRARRGDDVAGLIAEVRGRANHRGDRWDVFRQIADVAVARHAFDRLHLDGIPVIDIPLLLPPQAFGIDAELTWDDVLAAVGARNEKITSAAFKRWMLDNGTPISRETVARACLAVQRGEFVLDERAEHTLDQLGQTMLRLGATPRRLLDDL